MAKRPPPPTSSNDEDEWLVTYADAITLLLAFFVTTTAITQVDIDSDEVAGQIANALGRKQTQNPVALLESTINQISSDLKVSTDIPVGRDRQGMVFSIPANRIFQPGTDVIRGEAVELLTLVQDFMILDERSATYTVEVQGHASPQTQPGPQYGNSRWNLTADQAAAVVRFFIYYDASAQPGAPSDPNPHNQILARFKPIGFADSRPASANLLRVNYQNDQLPAFETLPDDRITIRIYPSPERFEAPEEQAGNG